MKIFISLLVLLSLTLFFNACSADQAKPSLFAGTYYCQGIDRVEHHKYYAKMIVTSKRHYDSFEWRFADGTVSHGVGVISATQPNVIAVLFYDVKDNKVIGVQVYTKTKDNHIQGKWVYQQGGATGYETCVFKKPDFNLKEAMQAKP